MADISAELAAILAAIYGEDVRGSIHDAIDKINKVSEVVISAGTAVSSTTSSSTGFYEDSLYINTSTCDLWKCTGTNAWTLVGNLKGVGIASITKTGTSGLQDTYTITYTDGSTPDTFVVTNGKDGTRWYKGTAISGKHANPTVYSGSGITNAQVDDFYMNMTEESVYHCVSGGDPTVATWVYDFDLSGGGGYGAGSGIDITANVISLDAGVDDLKDAAITTPADGQILTYEASTNKWKNKAPDKSYVRYSGAINYADLLTYASTYLTADYEDAFFLLKTSGTIGTGEASQYWTSNFSDGDVIPADAHIAVININRGTVNPAVYKYDDFGGFVDISNKADVTDVFTWIDNNNIPAGTGMMAMYDAAFKTTSRILLMADDGTGEPVKYKSCTVPSDGTLLIDFGSLPRKTDISVGVQN